MINIRRLRNILIWKCIVILIGIFLAVDLSGLHLHILETDYFTEFSYPFESPEFQKIVENFRKKDYTIEPLNTFYSRIPLQIKADKDCHESYDFIILCKSAPQNQKNREVIRKTWMQSPDGISVKTVFFLGKSDGIDEEVKANEDIAVIDFVDSYYNNTIKTMVEIRWAVELCPNFEYALLVDDDYFVSVKNLYEFTKYHEKQEKLYAGFSLFSSPLRHKIFNKWFISLEEYPFHLFPPYITAGAILLSKSAIMDIHYASLYVKPFRFDDIYVAIIAKKMNITPTHSENFRFWENSDESPEKDLIVSHGFRDPERLMKFWDVQNQHGFV